MPERFRADRRVARFGPLGSKNQPDPHGLEIDSPGRGPATFDRRGPHSLRSPPSRAAVGGRSAFTARSGSTASAARTAIGPAARRGRRRSVGRTRLRFHGPGGWTAERQLPTRARLVSDARARGATEARSPRKCSPRTHAVLPIYPLPHHSCPGAAPRAFGTQRCYTPHPPGVALAPAWRSRVYVTSSLAEPLKKSAPILTSPAWKPSLSTRRIEARFLVSISAAIRCTP